MAGKVSGSYVQKRDNVSLSDVECVSFLVSWFSYGYIKGWVMDFTLFFHRLCFSSSFTRDGI